MVKRIKAERCRRNVGVDECLLTFLIRWLTSASLFFSLSVNAQHADFLTSSDMVESSLSVSLGTQAINVDNKTLFITVDQYGLNNITNIIQYGGVSNLSQVVQGGNNNQALITQLGEGNVVNLLQKNNQNSFEIIQDGFDNVANINQLGEQFFTVHQTGNEMVINITQYKE